MRLFRKKPPPGLIPEAELSSVLRGDSAIRLAEPCFRTGNVTLEELAALSFIVNRPAQEPEFDLERQEVADRQVKYTLRTPR